MRQTHAPRQPTAEEETTARGEGPRAVPPELARQRVTSAAAAAARGVCGTDTYILHESAADALFALGTGGWCQGGVECVLLGRVTVGAWSQEPHCTWTLAAAGTIRSLALSISRGSKRRGSLARPRPRRPRGGRGAHTRGLRAPPACQLTCVRRSSPRPVARAEGGGRWGLPHRLASTRRREWGAGGLTAARRRPLRPTRPRAVPQRLTPRGPTLSAAPERTGPGSNLELRQTAKVKGSSFGEPPR